MVVLVCSSLVETPGGDSVACPSLGQGSASRKPMADPNEELNNLGDKAEGVLPATRYCLFIRRNTAWSIPPVPVFVACYYTDSFSDVSSLA